MAETVTLDQQQEQRLEQMLVPRRKLKTWNPDDLFVPASDGNGHAARQQFRIMPAMARIVGKIISTGKWFKTQDEFYRWAVWQGIREIYRREEKPAILHQIQAAVEILRDEEYHQEFDQMMEHMRSVVSTHMAHGNRGEAMKLTGKIRHQLDCLPDGEWKVRWMERFQRDFGYLLQAEGVPLGQLEWPAQVVVTRGADEVQ